MNAVEMQMLDVEREVERLVKNVECDKYTRCIVHNIDNFLKRKNMVVLNYQDTWRMGILCDGGKAVAPFENEMEEIMR